jgi:hypothetical protein
MNKPVSHDWNLMVELLRKWAANRSPYFAWHMILACIKEQREFPDWVIAYLGLCAERMCAERMRSEREKRAGEIRETFQWIFNFPKKKSGPGGLFDQDRELIKETAKIGFALNFALQLRLGKDPVQARQIAGDECFAILDNKTIDDKTLQRYLRELFQLKKLPRTIANG